MLCAEKVALIRFRFQEDDERKIQKTLFFSSFYSLLPVCFHFGRIVAKAAFSILQLLVQLLLCLLFLLSNTYKEKGKDFT